MTTTIKPELFAAFNQEQVAHIIHLVKGVDGIEALIQESLKRKTDERVKVSGKISRRDISLLKRNGLLQAIYYSNGQNAYHYYIHKTVLEALSQVAMLEQVRMSVAGESR